MTTVNISLKDLLNVASATDISFTLIQAVFTSEESVIKVGDTVTKTTAGDGTTTVNLSAGNYKVEVGSKSWEISVTGTGTANLIDLVDINVPTPVQRGLPPNGTTGQVLTKISDNDYDANWQTGLGANWGGITGTLSNQTDLQTALDNKININGNNSAITYENFTPSTAPAYQEGRVWYDSNTKTLSLYDNFSGTSIQLAKELIIDARNNTGSTILNGKAVYISGDLGQNPTIALAQANNLTTSEIIGIATHDIANNTTGKVTIIGIVNDIDTSAFSGGQKVYVSATTAGALTATPPVSPNFVVFVGYVSHAHPTQGKLLVMSEKALANNNSLGTSQVASPTQNAVKSYVDTGLNLRQSKMATFTVGATSDCDYIYNGTNIAVAINAAITAIPSSGGIIYIKEGDYLITSSILPKNKANLQLIGAGLEQTNITGVGLTTAFINSYNDVPVGGSNYRYKYLIKGMTLDNTTPATGSRGLYLGMLSDSKFEDIVIKNFEQGLSLNDGMFYNNFWNVKTEDCKFGVVTTAGPEDKPNSNFFNGCKFLADPTLINGSLGMHNPVTINDGNQNVFIGCQFENFTRGIYVNDIGNAFIANRVESNSVTASVNYVTVTASGQNNQFMSNYYSGNDFVDFTTSVVNNGEGNIFFEGNTFKGQVFQFERNLLTAGPVANFKRTGSGDGEAVITAEDTYAPSGTPTNYLAKAVRSAAKLFSGTLSGVENFYVTAQGQGYFANGLLLNSRRIQNVLDPTSAQDAATRNYVDNPFAWTPLDYNYISWNFDPASVSNNQVLTAGVATVIKLQVPRATTISNIILNMSQAGSANITNAYVSLHQGNTLLAQSADQSANWQSTGNKVIAITPQAVSAGVIDICVWYGSATTAPGFARGGSQAGANGALTGNNLRWATAGTGLTTTAPDSTALSARTTSNNTVWVAVS